MTPREAPRAQGTTAGGRRHLAVLLALRTVVVVFGVVTTFGVASEADFFYKIALEAAWGRWAGIDYWVEYPPFFPWLAALLYQVGVWGWPGSGETAFKGLLIGFNLLAEYANLVLLYLLGARLYSRALAFKIALVYAVLLPPIRMAMLGMIEPVVATFLLGGLFAWVSARPAASGALIGLGALIKLFPLAAAPGLLLALAGRERTRWVMGLGAAVVLPLLLVGPWHWGTLAAGLGVSAARPPIETPWAMLEGCCVFTPLPDPAVRTTSIADLPRYTSALPWILITGAFALAYAAIFVRRREPVNQQAALHLTLLTVCAYLLWSKTFSPQYVMWVLSLTMLALPGRSGMLIAIGHTAVIFAQYLPLRDAESVRLLLSAVIWARTGLLVWTAALSARGWMGSQPRSLLDPLGRRASARLSPIQ